MKRTLDVGISALTEFRFYARDESDLLVELIILKLASAALTQDRAKEVATSPSTRRRGASSTRYAVGAEGGVLRG